MVVDPDARWKCAICGKWHVVPSLARDCEKKHEKENQWST